MYLRCIECGQRVECEQPLYFCSRCGDLLEIEFEGSELKTRLEAEGFGRTPMSVWRYAPLLPIRDRANVVSMQEGGTRLHQCERLGSRLGFKQLYVKNEGENPTGSFKDRGMTVGASRAVELGATGAVCASTGNTAASLSAYAAKAGLRCIVLVPSGMIAYGKMVQAIVHGARILRVKGNFDQALAVVLDLSHRHPDFYLLNSVNPFRIEGQKTLAFEVCEQLGRRPDCMVLPVGNAGNISAAWKGFQEFRALGLIEGLPRMVGVQAEGAAPIAKAVGEGNMNIERVLAPRTVASAIRIGGPVSWKKALRAVYDSRGTALAVSDEEILEAQRLLAKLEGLFVEPASASTVAGLKRLAEGGEVDGDALVVCVATGHGLKDPDTVLKTFGEPAEVDADIESIQRALGIGSPE